MTRGMIEWVLPWPRSEGYFADYAILPAMFCALSLYCTACDRGQDMNSYCLAIFSNIFLYPRLLRI